MSRNLDNVTTTNAYAPKTTLACPSTRRLRIYSRNASIYYQTAKGGRGGALDWEASTEKTLYPGDKSFDVVCDGVRVRSRTPGVPAIVTIEALTGGEV